MNTLKEKLKTKVLRSEAGLTLTEMLVTVLIMVLASSLMVTGISTALDTYRKTVNTSNAQMALSTTLSVLKSELGVSTDVRVVTVEGAGPTIFYESDEGTWASIDNPKDHDGHTFRGLEKQYFAGTPAPNTDKSSVSGLGAALEDMYYPIVSDAAISDPLHVRFTVGERTGSTLTLKKVYVYQQNGDEQTELASVSDYAILLRFDQ